MINIDKRLTAAQLTAVNTAFTRLDAYLIGTTNSPGLLAIYVNSTPTRKALLRSHNVVLNSFLTLLEKANIYL